jgi:3-hydroxy-9,10-secoandrosta-1,3,5(10)-triene-9,17-dione monooxygenase
MTSSIPSAERAGEGPGQGAPVLDTTERDMPERGATGQDPTPEELIRRAQALRPRLRELQQEHEELGGYTQEIHEALVAAELYRILQPRRFGGLEYGLELFLRVAVEISRGDPGVGWSFVLGAGHTYHVCSFFGEQAQRELFGEGTLIAPSRTIPMGKAMQVEGGYRLSGTWDYCSGSMWGTYALVVAPTIGPDGASGGLRFFAVPRRDFTVLDDWGGGQTMGLQASSSNSVKVDDAFVPEHLSVHYDFRDHVLGDTGPEGFQVNQNPLYVGRSLLFFNAEGAAVMVGAALAALDEYEDLMRQRNSSFPPRLPRTETHEYHRWYGEIRSLTDAAEALLFAGARQYMELAMRWMETGEDFSLEHDLRLRGIVQQGVQMANRAVDLAFTTAGPSAAKRGSALQKYYRDVGMFRTHILAQWDVTNAAASRYHFGHPLTF